MANSANPEINKKIATSALGTLVIATVFFYLVTAMPKPLSPIRGRFSTIWRCHAHHVGDHRGCAVCPRYDQ